MALTSTMIERLVEWCARNEAIADVRARARSEFFGYDDPAPVNYMAGAGEIDSRERRFLGWFVFRFKLPDGRHPGELAASALLKEPELGSALELIRQARYVTAVVTSVVPGRGFYLELEDEEFEVVSRPLSRILEKGSTLCVHILPDGHGRWLPGPGWLVWPARFGPGIRSRLKQFQPTPIQVERFLQQRVKDERKSPETKYPRDATLEAAVARMSEAAKAGGKTRLIMGPEQWEDMVLSHMKTDDFHGFAGEILKRAESLESLEEANKWLALAANIWNTTPQPDRGGQTADELVHQETGQMAAGLGRQALDRLERSWRRDVESRPLAVNTALQAALNKLPAVWIDGICLCLGVPAERKKQAKARRIMSYLGDQASLARLISALQPQHREAVAHVLNRGGWIKYGELSRKFGDETADGWWWDGNPPQSVIGQLRLRGLLFVGRAPVGSRLYKVAVIPGELREPLLEALERTGSSQKAAPPTRVANARHYQALGNQLSELQFDYATFATEDENLKGYYERFMSYWNTTEYAQYQKVEGFGVEEYLWNFRLPGSDKFLLDCFLERKRREIPDTLKPGLLNWRGAELKCCRVVALENLLLLEDLDNGQRTWGFSLSIGGTREFRGSVGKLLISYMCPWDDITWCLLGYSVTTLPGQHSVEAYQDLKYALRRITTRTRRYFARPARRPGR